MILQKLIPAIAMLAIMGAYGCPVGAPDWECRGDKPCPKGELCVAPQDLPEGSTEPATDPACYTVCSSSGQCPGGNRACVGELCVLFDDDCESTRCPEGFFCNTLSHCEKLPCSSSTGVCAPSCADGLRDSDESDADCGGSCAPCADGRRCNSGGDCQSGVCDAASRCAVPACDDGVANGTEIGLDCGGGCDARCPAGEPCRDDSDCASAICRDNDGVCEGSACDDGRLNGGETAVDCGGPCAGARKGTRATCRTTARATSARPTIASLPVAPIGPRTATRLTWTAAAPADHARPGSSAAWPRIAKVGCVTPGRAGCCCRWGARRMMGADRSLSLLATRYS